jgi:FemAB-related protein (PEP-CTERM system-associated)
LVIKTKTPADDDAWDGYVRSHQDATVYHLSAWQGIIQKTYHHRTYFLMAVRGNRAIPADKPLQASDLAGVLPLVHLKHPFFGNFLVSLPYFDHAGIIYDDLPACRALVAHACQLGEKLKAKSIELRQSGKKLPENQESCPTSWRWETNTGKVSMRLSLPESADELMRSFKSKLRSQVKNPMKKGLEARLGGKELLEDFYAVFSVNMRDLGSPVHSRFLMKHVLEALPDEARIIVVHQEKLPLACSLVIGFGDTLENPWASALRKYSGLNPNMLLYWKMLEYACDNGYAEFNFGRSTRDESTYKFKRQWGATPAPLYWQSLSRSHHGKGADQSQKDRYGRFIKLWQRLPLSLANIAGPMIRKHISL